MAAPNAEDEEVRLAALRALQVLDTPPETTFDQLTRLTARTCHAPAAVIGLVDADRVWFKSAVGLDAITEVPRGESLCAAALPADGVAEIEDVWTDPRFASNPIVAGAPEMRFFAGAPLRLRGGQRIGALCVLDRHPRRLD
ncbi:MAG TPA: GAF domain-containing protein, partial [Thalassobaculum sp.]